MSGLPRDVEEIYQVELRLPFSVAENDGDADVEVPLWSPDRPFRVDGVQIMPSDDLALDSTDFAELAVYKADSSPLPLFGWSTEDDAAPTYEGGALTGGTPVEMHKQDEDDQEFVLGTDDVLALLSDAATSSAVVPPFYLVVRGRFVS